MEEMQTTMSTIQKNVNTMMYWTTFFFTQDTGVV